MISQIQAKYYAHLLMQQSVGDDIGSLSQSLLSATVDINPHQVDAALFAFRSPFSKGVMPEKKVILNSFIMSDTPSADLAHWWQMDKQTREAHHVMNLDNRDCVEVMMQMILQDSAM